MSSKERVVVTGVGLVTPLGTDPGSVWDSILEGKNGVGKLNGDYDSFRKYRVHVAALCPEVSFKEFESSGFQKVKRLNKADKPNRMLVFSGLKALADAGLTNPDDIEKYDVGAIVGCGTAMADVYFGSEVDNRNPKWFFDTYPNLWLTNLSMAASIKGFGTTIVTACVSGNQAIGEAYKKIQNGEEKILLAGAVDNKFSLSHASGFSRLNMTSKSEDPESACRPFDKNRDGLVIGQGACCLLLESLKIAEKRGVEIRAEIVGYGNSLDAVSLANASFRGKVKAMEKAIADAGLVPEDIGYINAHGTSTLSNDREESLAIKNVFGNLAYSIPISSTKSIMGHSFAASGPIEAFICMESLRSKRLHGNRNFSRGDQNCDLNYIKGKSIEWKTGYCLSNTSGMGGYNSTIIIGKI